jgi:hypothetical protein
MRARALLRLYPAAWQRRYGEELEDPLGMRKLTFSLALELARGGLNAHLHPSSCSRHSTLREGHT